MAEIVAQLDAAEGAAAPRALTIVQQINAERLVLLGWSRAILMQLSHPLVGAGIQHSAFRGGAIQAAQRLHHTVGAMLSLTYGDPTRRAATIGRIRAIHRTVHGVLAQPIGNFPVGTRYAADDPALLLWVHATLIDSVTLVYQRLVRPLTATELDQICRQSAPLLIELGGDQSTAPLTWPALQAYLKDAETSGVLCVSDSARRLGHAVIAPRAGYVPLPMSGLHRFLVAGLLPATLRTAYGFTWTASRQRRFEQTLTALQAVRRLTPDRMARWSQARQTR